jgi:tripartite-type tricarboxylate transporter receptor subunit TctC
VRLIVPLAPGGGMDATTRGLAQALTESLSQSVVVDNRPGAGSQVALDIVANAAPDGHTLCMLSATIVIHPLLYPSRYDVLRDFATVSQVTAQGYVLLAHPSLPVKSTLDLVKYAKANPGKLNYASSGIGSPIHMTTELFQIATGTKMSHIPYKGMGAAHADLVGGRIEFSFGAIISALPYIQSGRLRGLAVTPGKRTAALPDTPTLAEAGVPGVVVINWYGLVAPKAIPKALAERIAAETAEGVGSTPAQFAAHIGAEQKMWKGVIKQAGIKAQ